MVSVEPLLDEFAASQQVYWQGSAVSDAHVAEFGGVVPDFVMGLWDRVGFSGFLNGGWWLVDPFEWAAEADRMLRGVEVSFLDGDAPLVPLVRTAFGEFWFWNPDFGMCVKINPATGSVRLLPDDKARTSPDTTAYVRIDNISVIGIDLYDGEDRGVFGPVLDRLGPVGPDECYGFVPSVLFGFPPEAARAHKVKLREHLVLSEMISRGEVSFELGSRQEGGVAADAAALPSSPGGAERGLVEPVAAAIAEVADGVLGSWEVAVGTLARQVYDGADDDDHDDDEGTELALGAAVVAYGQGRGVYSSVSEFRPATRALLDRGWEMWSEQGFGWEGVKVTVVRGGGFEVEFTDDHAVAVRWVVAMADAVSSRREVIEILRPDGFDLK